MPIIYRLEKGSPLTMEEMDENFRALHHRLSLLEARPAGIETIQDITVDGNHFTMTSSYGQTFGPFILPTILFSPQGAWATKKAYAVHDVASYESALYVCIRAHTSDAFDADKERWRLLLERPQSRDSPITHDKEPSGLSLPLYEKAMLPMNAPVGSIALVFDQDAHPSMAYADGQGWRYAHNQQPL